MCPPAGIVAFLRQALDVTIETVRTKAQAHDFIGSRPWSLLLLHHRGLGGGVEPFLDKIRRSREGALIPIVYCLGKNMDPDLAKKLVKDFGVQSLLTYPPDPQEIAYHIADLLSLSLTHRGFPTGPVSGTHGESSTSQETRWESFKGILKEHVAALERAATDLLEGTFPDDMRQEAIRRSRRTALDAGGYGFTALAKAAGEAEQLLRRDEPWTPSRVLRFCEVVVELQEQADRLGTVPATEVLAAEALPLVLVTCRDEAFLDLLGADASHYDVRIVAAESLAAAAEALTDTSPDLVLLDIGGDGASREELDFIGDLAAHSPSIPVLVLTEGDSFKDRVSVAGAGGLGVIDKRESAATILSAAKEVLGQTRTDVPKILVVDDSELICRLASKLLERRGLHVTTLTDPLKFWDALEETNPDLLILDVEMPHLNGIELCRVVRGDPHWEFLPIVFLSAHTDAGTIQRLFMAGADDFISKPIVSAELITRVQNRLGRARLYRHRMERDSLTGVASRKAVEHMLERSLRLAKRYRDSFSLAVIDVDRLNEINDRHRTAAGDMVLRRLGQLFSKFFRPEDVIGRLGGDEFVIGLHRTSKAAAQARTEELLRLVRLERFATESGDAIAVSLSAGVAEFPTDGSEREAIYQAAGHALSAAKAAGRDCVVATGGHSRPVPSEQYDVVIIDDDEAVTDMLLRMLLNQGYRACRFQDGEEAFGKLGGTAPALRAKVLVLEVDVPGLDGVAILRRIRLEGGLHATRVIMLTHRSGEEEVDAMFGLGAFDHVAKPFSARLLLHRIRRALTA
ncbi:MAG TPA: response regulator [Nitrospiraceae bacterium]|nr:response regulator [Nitrospiraceae bacterium]